MKYKLLLLDIDGTLTASKPDALPSIAVVEAVRRAQKVLTVAVATGRPHDLAQPVINALQLRGHGIFNGGSEIINTATGKIEFEQPLSLEQTRQLVRIALPFGFPVYTNEDQYSSALQSADEVVEASKKIFIDTVANQSLDELVAALNTVAGVQAHPTSSWSDGDVMDIHVTHELATKRHGAEKLMELLHINQSEVVAVGDGLNDRPLLNAAGLKIAMGNAPAEVQAIADYVAPSLENDGVAEAIQKFVLQ